jgi:hypothetical protein
MYSFYIDNDDIKIFMNKLLKDDTFNGFELRSCEIKKNIVITMDGRINKDWYDEDVENDYAPWMEIRHYIFDIIKGKRTPNYIKMILSLKKSAAEKIHNNAKACFLNILFEEGKVAVVTGTAQKEFSLDKSVDEAWEDSVKKFFKKMKIVQHRE